MMKVVTKLIIIMFVLFHVQDIHGKSNAQIYYSYLISQVYKNQNQMEKAIDELEKLISYVDNEKDKLLIMHELIQINYHIGKYRASREWAKRVLDKIPDDNITHIIIAKTYLAEDRSDLAMEHLEDAIKYTNNIDLFLNLMMIYTQTRSHDRAINFFEKSRFQISEEIKNYFLLTLYYEIGDYIKAVDYLEKYVNSYQHDPDTKGKNIQVATQIILDLYEKKIEQKRLREVLKKFTEKDSENILLKLLYVHFVSSDKEKREEVLNILKEIESKEIKDINIRLDILKYYIEVDLNKAKQIYDILVKEHPEREELTYFLANIKEEEKKINEAIEIYRNILIESKNNRIVANTLLRLNDLMKKNNKIAELENILIDSLNRTKSYFVLQLLLDLYLEENQYDKAENLTLTTIAEYEKNLFEKPDNRELKEKISELKYNYLIVLDRKGEIEKALELAHKQLQDEPNNAHLLNFIGYTYVEQNMQLDKAEEYLKKAIHLRPNDPYILDSIGWLYFKKKNYEEALSYLNKALLLEPTDPTMLEHIAEIYYSMNNKEKALEYFKKSFQNIKKNDKRYNIIKKRIKDLQKEIESIY